MKKGKFSHHIRLEDIAQLVFGSSILAVPVAYTEETWRIGSQLHSFNVFLIFLLSITLIAIAIFHTGYHAKHKKLNILKYSKRVFLTYIIIFITVAIFLTLIARAPWVLDPIVAAKRCIIISLPASISGVAADLIK